MIFKIYKKKNEIKIEINYVKLNLNNFVVFWLF